ncbi:MAG: MmgE/PrpD family protein, partial [Betaproteobacteria bacterium]|nr:MmgE/PrpD family protein [Betaproteobacteria bacterium]
MTKPLLLELGEFTSATMQQRLDPDLCHHAKRALIDFCACAIAGWNEEPMPLLRAALAHEMDPAVPQASKTLMGEACSPRTAALLQGTAAHLVEFDDIFKDAIYHPGAPTIGAALALAAMQHSKGIDLLRAVIAGYEISTRIGVVMGRAHYRYWHNTGTIGSFGAAVAASALLKAKPAQIQHALAVVASFAAGLQQAFRMDSHSKPLHAGRAAEAGVLAGLGASKGLIGSLDVLDGDAGFGVAMSSDADWSKATEALGSRWHIASMTFKNHGCCGHTFAAIDGALILQQRLQLSRNNILEEIQSIEVASYAEALSVANIAQPRTAAEAKFSLRYVVAHALLYGAVRLDAVSASRLEDPAIRELMKRIDVR